MIYLAGDTHGGLDIGKLSTITATKKDYLIILGDFGVLWSDKPNERELSLLSFYNKQPYTTLFLDGNHENHSRLASYPVEEWHGGKIHRITNSVYHLMRGQVFVIEGLKFFTFGGALSIDKNMRVENISWWPQEIPNYAEVEEGLKNLENNQYNVDYVLTHTCPTKLINKMLNFYSVIYEDPTNEILDGFLELTQFNHWFFGHWHLDRHFKKPDEKFTCLYNDIITLKGRKNV
jgi:hypothetical protein